MRYLQNINSMTLFNKVHSCEICKTVHIKPILLQIDRSQQWCFSQMIRIPQEKLVLESCWLHPQESSPEVEPWTRWHDDISDQVWPVFIHIEALTLFVWRQKLLFYLDKILYEIQNKKTSFISIVQGFSLSSLLLYWNRWKICSSGDVNSMASGCFRGFSEKKRLNAHSIAREFLRSGMLYRPGKSLKRRGKSSSLHSKKNFLLGGCEFFCEWRHKWRTFRPP